MNQGKKSAAALNAFVKKNKLTNVKIGGEEISVFMVDIEGREPIYEQIFELIKGAPIKDVTLVFNGTPSTEDMDLLLCQFVMSARISNLAFSGYFMSYESDGILSVAFLNTNVKTFRVAAQDTKFTSVRMFARAGSEQVLEFVMVNEKDIGCISALLSWPVTNVELIMKAPDTDFIVKFAHCLSLLDSVKGWIMVGFVSVPKETQHIELLLRQFDRLGAFFAFTISDCEAHIPLDEISNLVCLRFCTFVKRAIPMTRRSILSLANTKFPNLTTMQVRDSSDAVLDALCGILEKQKFPRLRTLTVSHWSHTDKDLNRRLAAAVALQSNTKILVEDSTNAPKATPRKKTVLQKDKPAIIAEEFVPVVVPTTIVSIPIPLELYCECKNKLSESSYHYEFSCADGHKQRFHKGCVRASAPAVCSCGKEWDECNYVCVTSSSRHVKHTEKFGGSVCEKMTSTEIEQQVEIVEGDDNDVSEPEPEPALEPEPVKNQEVFSTKQRASSRYLMDVYNMIRERDENAPRLVSSDFVCNTIHPDDKKMPEIASEFTVAKERVKVERAVRAPVAKKENIVQARLHEQGILATENQCRRALDQTWGSVDLAILLLKDENK